MPDPAAPRFVDRAEDLPAPAEFAALGTGAMRAIGEATHVGRRTGVAAGRLVDAAGRLYALGSTTCLIFDF